MVRIYKRKYCNHRNGKQFKPYTSYSKESLQKAIAEIRAGSTTLCEAATKHSIPKSTLSRKYRGLNASQAVAGRPTLFSPEEEENFIAQINMLSEWGFPFDSLDIRIFAQKYLNQIGKTVYSLKNNMPGYDWAKNFLLRHKNKISHRYATNISTERAKLTENVIDSFFEQYIQSIDGVSPECIINYDETNLTDDPGNKKYIYRRGTKYPERVFNSSKTAISLMFSGAADGTMLPVYVVYKAEYLWDSWIQGGPEKARYNRSRSGWFDRTCFEDWFRTIIVPYAKKTKSRKVIIGDNLSSHFSETILQACEDLNIAFVCLPPKSTHVLQPLDVAFYGPLKHYWRLILTDWKQKEGRKHKTLVKTAFPQLLRKLVNKLTEQNVGATNIIAGFEKCGLYPINPERPKSRLPQMSNNSIEVNAVTTGIVVDMLRELREGTTPAEGTKRRKRCEVAPGKSITANDIIQRENTGLKKDQTKTKQRKGKVSEVMTENSDSDSDITIAMSDINEYIVRSPCSSESDVIDLAGITDLQPSTSATRNDEKIQQTTKKCKVKRKKIDKDADALRRVWEAEVKLQTKTKKKHLRLLRKDSTTSVSDEMSDHSDSDIIEAMSDDLSDIPFPKSPERPTNKRWKGKGKGKKTVEKENQEQHRGYTTDNEEKKYVCDNIAIKESISVKNKKDDKDLRPTAEVVDSTVADAAFVSAPETTVHTVKVMNTFEPAAEVSATINNAAIVSASTDTTISTVEIMYTFETAAQGEVGNNKSDLPEKMLTGNIKNFEYNKPMEDVIENNWKYDKNDTVLVRYYQRKNWKYYIGIIEKQDLEKYTIKFFSTVKKPDLKFIVTKKVDRDVVPAISIVKHINIVQDSERSKEYKLENKSDEVYFL